MVKNIGKDAFDSWIGSDGTPIDLNQCFRKRLTADAGQTAVNAVLAEEYVPKRHSILNNGFAEELFMGEYYIFALFLFVLCLLLIFAVKVLILKSDKPDTSRDEKLMKLYAQVEEMMESFEEYADDVKAELEDEKRKTLRDIRIEADDLKRESRTRTRENEPVMPRRKTDAAITENMDEDIIPPAKTSTRTLKSAADIYRTALTETAGGGKKEKKNIQDSIFETHDNSASEADEKIQDSFREVLSNEDLSVAAQVISMHESGMPGAKIAKKMNMNISEINLIIMKNAKK